MPLNEIFLLNHKPTSVTCIFPNLSCSAPSPPALLSRSSVQPIKHWVLSFNLSSSIRLLRQLCN
ncbi:unnamed protein product, partial [Vitis vinifera]